MTSLTIFVSLALPVLWWQSHGSWKLFTDAIAGKYTVKGAYPHQYGIGIAPTSSSSSSSSGGSSSGGSNWTMKLAPNGIPFWQSSSGQIYTGLGPPPNTASTASSVTSGSSGVLYA